MGTLAITPALGWYNFSHFTGYRLFAADYNDISEKAMMITQVTHDTFLRQKSVFYT